MIRPRTAAVGAAVLTVAATLAGCGSPGGTDRLSARLATGEGPARISVSDPYIPLPAAPSMAAGYLTLSNAGGTADRLVKVASPDARTVTMHRSTAGSMEPLKDLEVPAHGTAAFSRGGNHLMITGLDRRPAVGDTVELELTFAGSGTIAVRVPIKPLTYRPPGAGTASGS
ncbi:copper chaperone PCu(A)C [Peterkaempfera bronchialis]|uniref:Copper chaperone PCu(A)C n=1 Tax=Peterkaempfera bronchialis TaxID=2126346 RepID=A0A345SYA1_9ACTN|nr:copper chaperone PCu(A)C [Peterkaempfera bronchialis]AXI78706.1 copper chaperone PCu(A)C [Peterkaempfera bronchialis]